MKQLIVRSGKEPKDRITTFTEKTIPLLENHLTEVKVLHQRDLVNGYGEVYVTQVEIEVRHSSFGV